jgi:V8-like Glu-specific endopeptidase
MKMTRFVVVLLAACMVAPALLAAGVDGVRMKAMEAPAESFDRAAHLERMTSLQQRLSRSMVSLAATEPLQVQVSAERLNAIRNRAETGEQKMAVGVVSELSVPMDFTRDRIATRARLHETFGAVRGREDGGFEWSGVVRSEGATAGRIHFTDVDLPDGAELYVFGNNGMAFGPYTGRGPNGTGDFWSNTIADAEIVVHLNAGSQGAPRFKIAGHGHLTETFGIGAALAPRAGGTGGTPCSFNASCVRDAACVSTNTAVNTARNAVAHILFASSGGLYICTGGLIADSDTSTNVPYFMTANHCISSSGEASSMETFFFYTAPTCGSCPDPGAASTTGAAFVAGNRSSDYTLMRLSQSAPSGAAFLGWTSSDVANSNGAALFRLSHPKGAPQSYSAHVVDTAKVTCRSWPRGKWIYSRDILGATEGGSSGSPVVNAAGQFVGQLSGGCGYNVNDVCDAASNGTVDGAFAAYFTSVSSFLGSGSGGGTCTDADGDGYCVTDGDCNDNNANVHPGHSEKGKWRDGVDNDCDGVIDQ